MTKSIKRILLAILICAAAFGRLQAAFDNIDSLKIAAYNTQLPDSSRLEALIRYATKAYLKSNPDSAIYLANQVLAEATALDMPIQIARANSTKGSAAFNKGEYRQAIDYHAISLEIFLSLQYQKGVGNSYNNLGNSYLRLGEPTKAMKLYEKALEIWISTGDKFSAATSLYNLASIYMNYGNDARAIEAFTHALLLREEIDDQPGVAAVHNNIGVLYNSQGDPQRALGHFRASLAIRERIGDVKGQASNMIGMGSVYVSLHRLDSALVYFFKSQRLNREISAFDNIAQAHENIAEVYEIQGDYTLAKAYSDSALQIYTHTENAEGLAMVLNRQGEIYTKLHQTDQAIASTVLSLEIAQSIESVPNERDAAFNLYVLYKSNGQDRKALEMHELYMAMRDSVNSEENARSIIRSELQYEFEKDKLIKAQEKQQADQLAKEEAIRRDRLQYSLISGFVIFLLLGLLVLGLFRVQQKFAFAMVFLAFLVVFEFILVLIDPYTEPIAQGQPVLKFLINLGLALMLTPIHHYLEGFVQRRLIKLPNAPQATHATASPTPEQAQGE